MTRPRAFIDISMGEPSGIGPEVAVKAWLALQGRFGGRPIRLVGAPGIFLSVARGIGGNAKDLAEAIVDTGHAVRAEPGKPSKDNAAAVSGAIECCVKNIQTGESAALVTAPIHKSVLAEAGFAFPGHTEFLASLTGTKRPVMMLASELLRVVPLTIHVPLSEVLRHITHEAIITTAEVTVDALRRDFSLARPRLAVAGLNPHAGEDGELGREERDIIAPAVAALHAKGMDVAGPFSPDSMFHEEARKGYDAVLCMYHDQALIPIKTLAFWNAVNVTLGLPIVRTSPDHGTALSLAGQGKADPRSMIAAVKMAAEIAERRGL
ncbi:MAG: 4-hydroxythreonine-4-phosphate dehydrogenase PdxA [Alphaproteobacteria bacterium]